MHCKAIECSILQVFCILHLYLLYVYVCSIIDDSLKSKNCGYYYNNNNNNTNDAHHSIHRKIYKFNHAHIMMECNVYKFRL